MLYNSIIVPRCCIELYSTMLLSSAHLNILNRTKAVNYFILVFFLDNSNITIFKLATPS